MATAYTVDCAPFNVHNISTSYIALTCPVSYRTIHYSSDATKNPLEQPRRKSERGNCLAIPLHLASVEDRRPVWLHSWHFYHSPVVTKERDDSVKYQRSAKPRHSDLYFFKITTILPKEDASYYTRSCHVHNRQLT